MQRSKNHGFSVVEIILVVVVIAVLGFVGWRVYDARKDKDVKDTKNTSTATPSATPSPKDEAKKDPNSTADWLHYEAPEYSISFADGWTVYKKESSQNSFYSVNDGDLKYISGQKAVVKEYSASAESEPIFGFFMDYISAGATPNNCADDSSLKLASYTTDGGSAVYTSALSSSNQKTYSYCVQFSNNAELYIGYAIPQSAEDHSATIERVVRTVKIK